MIETAEKNAPHRQSAQSSFPLDYQITPVVSSQNLAFASLSRLTQPKTPCEHYFPKHPVRYGKIEALLSGDTDPQIDEPITAMASAIRAARHSLVGQTYIFDPHSQAAQQIFMAVAEAQRRNPNFEFVLIVNTFSSPKYKEIIKEASEYGVHLQLAQHGNNFGRGSLHSKSWVIDGVKAYIGGDNIDNTPEHDFMVCVSGPVVNSVKADLLDAWHSCSKHVKSTAASNTTLEDLFDRQTPLSQAPGDLTPFVVLSKRGIGWLGSYYEGKANQGILHAIGKAQHSVQVMGPNVNDTKLLEALCAAAQRGCKVQILAPRYYQDFVAWLDNATNSAPMIYRTTLPKELRKNFEVRYFSTDGKKYHNTHAKFYAIDDTVAIFGSQNPDNQSFCFSREFNLASVDRTETKRLKTEIFDTHWKSSIPAKECLWHHLVPITSDHGWRRFNRLASYPLEAVNYIYQRTWRTPDKASLQRDFEP